MIIKQLKESYCKEYKLLDSVIKKKRNNTISSRVRTPLPPNYAKQWQRNKSNHDKSLGNSKIAVKTIQNTWKGGNSPGDIMNSATPQPRPGTFNGNERRKTKNDADEGKISDFILNSYDLY